MKAVPQTQRLSKWHKITAKIKPGLTYEIRRGIDFKRQHAVSTVRMAIYRHATKMGLVAITSRPNTDTLRFTLVRPSHARR